MGNFVPIKPSESIELVPTARTGVSNVRVNYPEARGELSWDRYVRLKSVAQAVRQLEAAGATILDVGGYDGALGFFLLDYKLDLIDPATTGASLLHQPVDNQSYDIVVAVDVLEHIAPAERPTALKELARAARRYVLLNYPCSETIEAQALMLQLTNNALVREHVQWELPDTDWVLNSMRELGFHAKYEAYGSLAVWLGQYLTLNLAPDAASVLNQYLVEHHSEEPFSTPLYHLVVCER